jgi:YidC/Oxa1 family membrane protein insertase
MKRFTVQFLLLLLSVIVPASGADSISINVNSFSYVFSPFGNLHTINYNEPGLSKPVIISNSFSDFISIASELDDTLLSGISPEHQFSQNDSQSIITFVLGTDSNTFVKQFCISKFSNTISVRIYNAATAVSKAPVRIVLKTVLSKLQNEHYRHVTIDNMKKKVYELNPNSSQPVISSNWTGIRSRFTTVLLRSVSDSIRFDNRNDTSLQFSSTISGTDTLSYVFYAGPVKYTLLRNIGNNAEMLMFPLWFWMRWLSLGIMYLFDFLKSFSSNLIIAIILLSICVKIILSPLFHIADKWQKKVNYQNGIIQPRIAEIKKQFKGEEQTHRILALHKELGISPLYSLKSLFSAAIQIPIFFAAYHALSEHYALFQASAGFISDLSKADGLLPLPFVLPFIGDKINILPFVMTAITFASSWLHTDKSLSAKVLKKQRTNLYGMAIVFFVLLYTSPSGMVLYWTINNLLAFLSTICSSFFQYSKHQSIKGTVP